MAKYFKITDLPEYDAAQWGGAHNDIVDIQTFWPNTAAGGSDTLIVQQYYDTGAYADPPPPLTCELGSWVVVSEEDEEYTVAIWTDEDFRAAYAAKL